MVLRTQLEAELASLLEPTRFNDYGPNGLQVEGCSEVRKLVSGVTASQAFIEAALDRGADAILVHHGLFWKGHVGPLTGWLKRRVQTLLVADLNLFAYHLPLDAHPQLGNNAQLGARLGLQANARFGEQDLGWLAPAPNALTLEAWAERVAAVLGREPLAIPGDGRNIRKVAWCTGGAQAYFQDAIEAGADLFLTGEISEPQAHWARESGVAYLACGHHATERYGVAAVGDHIAARLGLTHEFIDVDNPA